LCSCDTAAGDGCGNGNASQPKELAAKLHPGLLPLFPSGLVMLR
jgi:hypothetical protein